MKEPIMKKTGLFDGGGSEFDESKHPRDSNGEFASKGGSSTFSTENIAKGFVNIKLFGGNYEQQTDKQLKSSLKSHKKIIEIHNYKILHPQEFYRDWDKMSDNEKNGRLSQWQKEIKNFSNQIKIIENELKKRSNL